MCEGEGEGEGESEGEGEGEGECVKGSAIGKEREWDTASEKGWEKERTLPGEVERASK